jgi:hypothetical protein
MAEVVVFGVVAADVVLRVKRIPAPGDHVNAEALGWRIGGSSANVACGLSTAGHHVRLVGPVGTDPMGDNLLAELERCGVDTEYTFRADAASPRTLILLDDTGERTIIAVDSRAEPSSFLPLRGPALRSADCVYIEGYTRYSTGTATSAESALLVTSPPVPGATTWPATVVVGSETQYHDATSAEIFETVRSVSGERLKWVVVTRAAAGADAYTASSELAATGYGVSRIVSGPASKPTYSTAGSAVKTANSAAAPIAEPCSSESPRPTRTPTPSATLHPANQPPRGRAPVTIPRRPERLPSQIKDRRVTIPGQPICPASDAPYLRGRSRKPAWHYHTQDQPTHRPELAQSAVHTPGPGAAQCPTAQRRVCGAARRVPGPVPRLLRPGDTLLTGTGPRSTER